jgi:hypothetical protein
MVSQDAKRTRKKVKSPDLKNRGQGTQIHLTIYRPGHPSRTIWVDTIIGRYTFDESSMKEGRHDLIPPRIFWRHNRENQNLCKQQCWNAEEQRWKNQRYAACQTEVRRCADREN